MKALITGINGFVGGFLAEKLLSENCQVSGTIQPGTSSSNLEKIKSSLSLFTVDLQEDSNVRRIIRDICPDVIYHLAGASSVKESFENPKKFFDVNVIGSVNLLEAIRKYCPKAVILVVTSSEVYGESLVSDRFVNEASPFLPKSPYAISKAALDLLAIGYARSYDLKVIVARPSTHVGPKQNPAFFVSSVAKQIAQIKKNIIGKELYVGNLDLYRDFLDVRDVVNAYFLLSQKGEGGEAYNVSSMQRYLLKDIVHMLIGYSGINDIDINIDPARLRKKDVSKVDIDSSKIKKTIGWIPKIKIEKTLEDILFFWLDSL